ncbi:MAG: AAA family ATPase, partial [Rubrivivax sp.]|nr:AAA family ATPase [Rubrivivax sp.]
MALAYRPQILLLDEPSSGLDPSARRDILGAIVRTVADEGRTVIFSSHLLDEVERMADVVAMIHAGK